MALFNYNGINIFYEIKGKADSNKVVAFFNGVMASTSSWYKYVDLFERLGYKIVLHDFKGQLKSDKTEGPYTFDEHVQEAKALFEYLNISSVQLVGTSYGGEVAMKFAITQPEMIESITIIDSVSELDEIILKFVNGWIELCDFQDGEKFFRLILPTIYGPTYLAQNKEALEKRALAMKAIDYSYFVGQKYLYQTFINDVVMTHQLHKIKCPALIICGEDDILKPVKFSKIIANNIKQSELVIVPDCGHVAIYEKFEELLTLITGFIIKNTKNK